MSKRAGQSGQPPQQEASAHDGFCFVAYDTLFGPVNPFRVFGQGARGNVALAATTVGLGASLYGLYSLYGDYQADLTQRREDYQEKYEKHLEKLARQKEIAEQKAAERAANAEKKQKRVEEKKKQQAERAVTLQKEREQQRLEKEKEKQSVVDAKKKAQLDKEKSPALIDVTNFFQLPENDIIAILQESQATLIRDVQTFGALAITGGRNATQPARRTAMRNQSIYTQITHVNTATFSQLAPLTRLELSLWLAYFVRIKYADVTSRGFKRGELLRDNELVLRYLEFSDAELADFKRSNLADLYRTTLDVSQVIDDITNLSRAYDWLFTNSPLKTFIAEGGADSTESPQTDSINSKNTDPSKRDEELEAKTLYLSLPVDKRKELQTDLDLYNLIALLPVSCVLGRWDDFRKLAADYLVYSPPGPNGGLEELQRSYAQLPHEPNLFALNKMATVFSPTIEEFGDAGVSIPFVDIATPIAEMTQEERDEIQRATDEDSQKRFDAFITNIKQSLAQDESVPIKATQQAYSLDQLKFKEYHIRSAIIEFNRSKSYHAIRSNLANYKSVAREPKVYGPGDKKIIVRGGVASIQDINTHTSLYHFGPYDNTKNYTFVSETVRAVARTTVNQSQVFVLEQSEEDLYGRSTWNGYFRITQTPTGQTDPKPTFSFYFNVTLECQRVLTPEEKAICDELLAQEALAKAEALASHDDEQPIVENTAAEKTSATKDTTQSVEEHEETEPTTPVVEESSVTLTDTVPASHEESIPVIEDSVVIVNAEPSVADESIVMVDVEPSITKQEEEAAAAAEKAKQEEEEAAAVAAVAAAEKAKQEEEEAAAVAAAEKAKQEEEEAAAVAAAEKAKQEEEEAAAVAAAEKAKQEEEEAAAAEKAKQEEEAAVAAAAEKAKQEEEEAVAAEKAKQEEEEAVAAEKAKQEEEEAAAVAAAEKAKQEEEEAAAAEKAKQEEEAAVAAAAEKAKQEEEEAVAAEKAKQEEEEAVAAEKAKQEEEEAAAVAAAEKAKQEEEEAAAAEKAKQEEEAAVAAAAEKAKQEEEEAVAAEKAKQEEEEAAAVAAAEKAKQEEEEAAAAEKAKQEEEEAAAAEKAKQEEEAAAVAAAEKAKQEEEEAAAAEKAKQEEEAAAAVHETQSIVEAPQQAVVVESIIAEEVIQEAAPQEQ